VDNQIINQIIYKLKINNEYKLNNLANLKDAFKTLISYVKKQQSNYGEEIQDAEEDIVQEIIRYNNSTEENFFVELGKSEYNSEIKFYRYDGTNVPLKNDESVTIEHDETVPVENDDDLLIIYAKILLNNAIIENENKLIEVKKKLKSLQDLQKRKTNLLLGIIDFPDESNTPYEHRLAWITRPENSGIIRIKPIVVSGITNAYQKLKDHVDWMSKIKEEDYEKFQHQDEMRGYFASLVATEMSAISLSFPKQYRQLGERKYTILERKNALLAISKNFKPIFDNKTQRLSRFQRLSDSEKQEKRPKRTINSVLYGYKRDPFDIF